MCEFSNRKFIIVAGATKAATTSMYEYLASHPEVCASSIKETRYFIDDDYPIPRPVRFCDGLIAYSKFFRDCKPHQVLMESTPDYLYSKTALNIADTLPNAKLIFIFRDPVDRLKSWFRYAKLKGLIENECSFQHYIEMQRETTDVDMRPMHLRSLQHGCYSKYISAFRERMAENILLVSFDALVSNPVDVMHEICNFAHVKPTHFDEYDFMIKNRSHSVKFQWLEKIYRELIRGIAYKVHSKSWLLDLLRLMNYLPKMLMRFNKRASDEVVIDDDELAFLRRYYAADITLCNLLSAKKVSLLSNINQDEN